MLIIIIIIILIIIIIIIIIIGYKYNSAMYSLHAVSKVFLSMFKGKSDVKACFSKIFILPCCAAINLTRPKRKVALTSENNA